MPRSWIQQRNNEYYFRKAKAENYRSRAAYKLLQSVRKFRFITLGKIIVDLGAYPGGWTQVSTQIVGESGLVISVDIKEIEPFNSNVHVITGDITQQATVQRIKELLPRLADVVISDVSPNISGVWELDHARQIHLARSSLDIATSVLHRKGNFFVKVFQGDLLAAFLDEVKRYFTFVKLVKPRASRGRSSELYLLGMHFTGAGEVRKYPRRAAPPGLS